MNTQKFDCKNGVQKKFQVKIPHNKFFMQKSNLKFGHCKNYQIFKLKHNKICVLEKI
jgi:hypothetical protein